MADNVTFQSATPATPSAGTIVSADEASGSGAKVQRVKLAYSADGSETHVAADADGLLVNLGANNDVTVTGSVAATQSGTWTVVVSGTVAISAAALPLPSGAATAAKQPAIGTAGTPSADVISVQGVSGGTALPVSQSGTWSVTVADGGGSITVDGSVSITGSVAVTDGGGSLTVDAPVGTPVFVRLSDGSAAITTLPVSLASVPSHAVTNAGTFAVQASGDVAHDGTDSGAPMKIGAKATAGQSGATMVAAGDRTDLAADIDGVQIVRAVSLADVLSEAISNTDGNSTACATFGAVSGKKNVVTAIHAFRTDAGTTPIYVDFRDGTSGSVIYRVVIPAGGGAVIGTGAAPIFKQPTANTALAYDVSAATSTVYVNLTGFQTKA